MGPLIDKEVENIDRQHNQLSDVNAKLMDALNLYHSAMKEASAYVQVVNDLGRLNDVIFRLHIFTLCFRLNFNRCR